MKKDDIVQALEIVDNEPKQAVTKIDASTTDVERDFEYARTNMYDIIEHGQKALEASVDYAIQSQQPRAFEVVSSLVNSLTNANKDLLAISKTKKELQEEDEEQSPQQVNNNLFVGSTADLQKLLAKDKEDGES